MFIQCLLLVELKCRFFYILYVAINSVLEDHMHR